MTAHFEIVTDHRRNLLDVRMGGFFSVDDVRRYHTAIDKATAELGGSPARQRMLCDITEMRIQPQDVVAAFADFMADPRYANRKVGFVVDTTLARMQLNRAKADRHAQSFSTRGEAEAWLFAEDRAAA